MNTASLLNAVPSSLRDELIDTFSEIERNFIEHRWEPSELNGGKLCEVVYTIIKGELDGSFPSAASKPSNMLDACKKLEQYPSTKPRALRIQIPRMLVALYEIRNNRGVGHVGGDVNPNEMDALCVLQMCKWIVGELIRCFHDVSTEAAQAAVQAISQRELSLIWTVNGISRVLDPKMKMADKTLVLLYASPSGLKEQSLVQSVEHSNPSIFRRDVLRKLHKAKMIEFDETAREATISPIGSTYVEKNILASKCI